MDVINIIYIALCWPHICFPAKARSPLPRPLWPLLVVLVIYLLILLVIDLNLNVF